ncbi:MAG: tyrosine-protein kinase Etk/Wzc, partial [Dokdonia sp.]
MDEDFDIQDSGSFFDFKGFVLKVLSFWPLFIFCLSIAFGVAYYQNIRKQAVYRLSNMISIKDDQNPLFTGNTSLIFNWGGTTDKVQTNIILFKSRTHTEKVVSYLQYYINYTQQGKYNVTDVYGKTPFKFRLNDTAPQLYGKRITIKDIGDGLFEFTIPFSSDKARLYNYSTYELESVSVPTPEFKETVKLGDTLNFPFLKGVFQPTDVLPRAGREYFVSLSDFNGTVIRYRGISVLQNPRGSSILELSLSGTNKDRIVDYLNASVIVREKDQLERKNLFATNTIKFIDSSLTDRNKELQSVINELNEFKNNNIDVALKGGSAVLTSKLKSYDSEKEDLEKRLSYYDILEKYLTSRTDYGSGSLPAPSVAGITEGSISASVSKIITLSVERSDLQYSAKEGNPKFREIDRSINAEKEVLLENIKSSTSIIDGEITQINRNIIQAEAELRKYPEEEQELATIERKFTLSQGAYNLYLSKRSEATIIKASNVSDILFIDDAKDVGGGQVGPNTRLNYIVAAIVGGIIPLVLVFLLVFFNTKIGNPDELKKLSQIPVLGIIGKSKHRNNLVVRERSRSSISESFRGLRSSLQFMYRKKDIKGAKTVLVTSSVSGEGKTFTSINIASVFALSEKKTVLVGLDLRKPKIFDDFELSNESGVVNYLIGDSTVDDIKQESGIPHLDIILSGPIPPNPSELLLSDAMAEFMEELKKKYDYIVL